MTNSERGIEVDRLWAAIKRDYFVAVENFAGLRRDEGDRRWKRLVKNWRALCSVDTDLAARLARGLHEVSVVFDANHRGPADGHLQQLDDTLDRAADHDAEVEHSRKVYELGEEALQRRIDEDPGRL
jgi:hypothetical protein